ncbi:hypothetical protein ACFLXD_06465 [Chloroflexota bacterium]
MRADEETRDIPIIVLTFKDLTEKENEMLSRQTMATMKKTIVKREDIIVEVKKVEGLGKA